MSRLRLKEASTSGNVNLPDISGCFYKNKTWNSILKIVFSIFVDTTSFLEQLIDPNLWKIPDMVGQGLKIRTNCKNLSVPPLHTTAHQCQSIHIFGAFQACILFWWKRREGFNELPLKINYFEINLCFRSPHISERRGHGANSRSLYCIIWNFLVNQRRHKP